MLNRLIKSVGFGLFATGIQDNFFEDSPSIYNWVATATGGVLYLVGTYLELKAITPEVLEAKTCITSTQIIKQGLEHAGGIGLVNSITHFAKRVDNNSANLANLTTALFVPGVINELESDDELILPNIKWEKSRFILLITADYFAASGGKNILNGTKWDLMSIISFPIAVSLAIGEWIYGRRNDEGLNLQHAMMRRGIKVAGMMNIIFSLYDFITGVNDKYTIADDSFAIVFGAMLFAVTLKLSNLCKPNINLLYQPTLNTSLVADEKTASNAPAKTTAPSR